MDGAVVSENISITINGECRIEKTRPPLSGGGVTWASHVRAGGGGTS